MPPSTRDQAAAISRHHATLALSFFKSLDDLSSFTPNPSDIFIVSFMKSGTTLLQQLLYQLLAVAHRVPSDPTGENFTDISQVVPFIDARSVTGVAQSPNPYTPRVWKSHSYAHSFQHMITPDAAGPRFIYCFREGRDVIRSYADFALDWLASEPIQGRQLRAEVYRKLFLNCYLGLDDSPAADATLQPVHALYDWFGHVKGWLQSTSPHVLYVHYNDLINDLDAWVKRIARFVAVDLNQQQVDRVVAKCDRSRMAADLRFRDRLISNKTGWKSGLGLRVRNEHDDGFRSVQLPPECELEYCKRFRHVFGDVQWHDVVRRAEARNKEAGV
eukprot:GFKZ01010729.1.p1 GENE.GFKZ01010729.1~~GFKZ01010729.1.p1  ORF type:complete len:338 (-),score=30.04 GFKZ01010729.1:242-1231(-)